MKRIARCSMILFLLLGAWQERTQAAQIIFDTAAPPTTNSGLILGDFNWPLHRFYLSNTTTVESIGGTFDNNLATLQVIFGAIVQLSSSFDLPDSLDLTTPDVLGTTLIALDPGRSDAAGALHIVLALGWYAVEFGTGAFGASSRLPFLALTMPSFLTDLDPGQLDIVAIQVDHPRGISPGFDEQAPSARFFVTGVIPEPSTVGLLGVGTLILLGVSARQTGLRAPVLRKRSPVDAWREVERIRAKLLDLRPSVRTAPPGERRVDVELVTPAELAAALTVLRRVRPRSRKSAPTSWPSEVPDHRRRVLDESYTDSSLFADETCQTRPAPRRAEPGPSLR